ncbi:hypothetical protein ACFQ88_19440 [Paenibacillus sp. NPDC056579]|uniref:hypothetical protein n=1 Tax=unclassified Paenibacillus TaxID=185978 RepID=UPI001EF92DCC|nr:hypothetical protein [Paenibacillus sp. H1-7]ULL16852.1 hypothetical protein DVH26_21820 [Paenibacillus sp. H1-7]
MNCLVHQEAEVEFTCPGCQGQYCNHCRDEYLTEYCDACAISIAKKYLETSKFESQRKRNIRRGIGWYQIVGGLLGMLMSLFFGIQIISNKNWLVVVSIFGGFFILSVILVLAGVLILKDRKYGKRVTVFIQILQIPQFTILGVTYKFLSGLALMLTLKILPNVTIGINFHFLNSFNFAVSSNHTEMYISINVIPILLISYLIRKGTEYK